MTQKPDNPRKPIPIDYISVVAVECMAQELNDSSVGENNGFSYNERLARVCLEGLKKKFHLVIKEATHD